jgi:hypothetical protein
MARQVSPSPVGKGRSSTTGLHNKVTAASSVLDRAEDLCQINAMLADVLQSNKAQTTRLKVLSKALSNVMNDLKLDAKRSCPVAATRKVLLPFVNDIRQSLGQAPGTLDIDEALTAVSWQDGDHAQLAAVTAEDLLEEYKQQRITMCKHNPGRTGVEQPCDLSPIFMLLKALEKTMTCKNKPSPLKELIKKVFNDHSHQVKLKPTHSKALIDFLSCLPEMLQKAVSTEKISKGFLVSGMIDEGSLEMPDLYKMIGTSTRTVTKAEFDLIEKSFPVLLQEVFDHGRIKEETFDSLGFEQDINMWGKEAPRVAEITNNRVNEPRSCHITEPESCGLLRLPRSQPPRTQKRRTRNRK